jgi:hypothetical protein
VIIAFLWTAAAMAFQVADTTGVLRGRVIDASSGAGVPQAAVSVVGALTGAYTDAEGRFLVPRVPAGEWTVRARLLGWRPGDARITMRAGDTVTVTLRLSREAAQLTAVRTTAASPEREAFLRKPDAASVTVRGEVLKRLPVIGEPDVLRVVQLLPGVVATNDFTAGYNVRGGESDQNLVLLDGFPIYNPFHLGGLFGTFIDETVGDFELVPGGFPARYGTRLSSVLSVNPKAEERPGIHGALGVSVLASSLALGGTTNRGRTSWNIAGRRTYADRFIAAVSDNTLPYYFSDLQAHVKHRLPGSGTLSFTGYVGQDVLDASLATFGDSTQAGGGKLLFDWGNAVGGLAWQQPLGSVAGSDSSRLMQRVSYTRFGTTLDLGSGSLTFKNRVDEARAWGEYTHYRGRHEMLAGYEWSAYAVDYDVRAPQTGASDIFGLRQRPSSAGVYLDDTFRASDQLLLRAGLRGETVTGTGWSGLSPRLSVKWLPTPKLAFTLAGGVVSQWSLALRNEQAPVRVFDFWLTSDRFIPVARARQAIAGVERWFDDARFIRVEGYYKYYSQLPASNLFNDPDVRGDEFIITTGRSYGVDVLLRQLESEKVSGWLAYSLAVSVRDGPQGRFYPVHDRRQNLNAVLSYKPGGRWQFGVRLGIGTGVPFTDIAGQLVRRTYNGVTNTWETGVAGPDREPLGGPRNGARFPLFQRLDISATRTAVRWGLTWSPFFSVINAYNARNVFTYVFDYADNPPTRSAFSQFPLLPTVGLSVSW